MRLPLISSSRPIRSATLQKAEVTAVTDRRCLSFDASIAEYGTDDARPVYLLPRQRSSSPGLQKPTCQLSLSMTDSINSKNRHCTLIVAPPTRSPPP